MCTLRLATLLALVLVSLMVAAPAALAQAAPGDLLWSYLSGLPDDDAGRAVAVTPEGNFVGAFGAAIGQEDPYIRVHAFTVAQTWPYVQNGGVGNLVPDNVAALALAPDGSPFLAGWTKGPSASQDYLLTSFDPLGNPSGVKTYDGPSHGTDVAVAVAVDSSGACYVTGSSQSGRASGDQDIVTIRYDSTGDRAWAKRLDGPDHKDDQAVAVAVRGSWVYVVGTCSRIGHGKDIVLTKYNAVSGARAWTRYYDDARQRNDAPTDLVVTSTAVYVGGWGRKAGTVPSDALLVKLGLDGSRKWAKYMGGAGPDLWSDLELAPDGRVRTVGSTWRSATGGDLMTASWRSDGTYAWRTTFSSLGVYDETGVALAVDTGGTTFVVCSGETEALDQDIRVLAYTPAGGTAWIGERFGSFVGEDDVPADIAVSGAAVAVVGTSDMPAGGRDYLILAYEK